MFLRQLERGLGWFSLGCFHYSGLNKLASKLLNVVLAWIWRKLERVNVATALHSYNHFHLKSPKTFCNHTNTFKELLRGLVTQSCSLKSFYYKIKLWWDPSEWWHNHLLYNHSCQFNFVEYFCYKMLWNLLFITDISRSALNRHLLGCTWCSNIGSARKGGENGYYLYS